MQRNQVIQILIVVLVVFNIVRWWPQNSNNNKIESWQAVDVSQLALNGVTISSRYRNTRNLFYEEDIDVEIKEVQEIMPVVNDQVNNEFPNFRLVGVIFKDKHFEAFLIKGEERFKVRLNKYVTPGFKVQEINFKSIKLKDVHTGKLHEIILSDG